MLRLLTRLVLLLALGFFAPGEAAARVAIHVGPPDVSAQKLASWGSAPEVAVLRQAAALQAAELQQGSASHSYDFASGCCLAAESAVPQGTRVFRVWGDEAAAGGRSWTTVDPRTVPNYRNAAGLPNQNSGRFLSEGILDDASGVRLKPADSLHGNAGGLPEVVVPNPNGQIRLLNVQGLNPEF